jgi:hypothetical protein
MHVECMGEMRNYCRVLVEKRERMSKFYYFYLTFINQKIIFFINNHRNTKSVFSRIKRKQIPAFKYSQSPLFLEKFIKVNKYINFLSYLP